MNKSPSKYLPLEYILSKFKFVEITVLLQTQCENTSIMLKNKQVSKIVVCSLQDSQKADFSWTCGFRKVLDNVGLIAYVKFQKISATDYRYVGKKHKNAPKMGFFPQL